MRQEEKDQFEREKTSGSKASHVYKSYVQNFCQTKRESLFGAFSDLPITAERELMEVKRMLYAIDTLESEILSEIETGRLATISLTEQAEAEAEALNNQEVH